MIGLLYKSFKNLDRLYHDLQFFCSSLHSQVLQDFSQQLMRYENLTHFCFDNPKFWHRSPPPIQQQDPENQKSTKTTRTKTYTNPMEGKKQQQIKFWPALLELHGLHGNRLKRRGFPHRFSGALQAWQLLFGGLK